MPYTHSLPAPLLWSFGAGALKVGLGLWNYPVVASALEIASLFGGMYLYYPDYRATTPVKSGGRSGMVMFGLAMLALQATVFSPPPPAQRCCHHGARILFSAGRNRLLAGTKTHLML